MSAQWYFLYCLFQFSWNTFVSGYRLINFNTLKYNSTQTLAKQCPQPRSDSGDTSHVLFSILRTSQWLRKRFHSNELAVELPKFYAQPLINCNMQNCNCKISRAHFHFYVHEQRWCLTSFSAAINKRSTPGGLTGATGDDDQAGTTSFLSADCTTHLYCDDLSILIRCQPIALLMSDWYGLKGFHNRGFIWTVLFSHVSCDHPYHCSG